MVDSAGFSEEESKESEKDTPLLTTTANPKVTSSSLSGTQGN